MLLSCSVRLPEASGSLQENEVEERMMWPKGWPGLPRQGTALEVWVRSITCEGQVHGDRCDWGQSQN